MVIGYSSLYKKYMVIIIWYKQLYDYSFFGTHMCYLNKSYC